MGWYSEALLWPMLFCGVNGDGHVRGPTGMCHSLATNKEGGIFQNCISSCLSELVSGCCFLESVTATCLHAVTVLRPRMTMVGIVQPVQLCTKTLDGCPLSHICIFLTISVMALVPSLFS